MVMAAMAPMTAVAGTAAGVVVSMVVAAVVAVVSAEAADHQQDLSDSLLSTHGDGTLCSDGDGDMGGSGDGGDCGGGRRRGGGGGGGDGSTVLNQTASYSRLVSDFSRALTTAETISLSVCLFVSLFIC